MTRLRAELDRAQTADRFFVTMVTIATWVERVDEAGERALVQFS